MPAAAQDDYPNRPITLVCPPRRRHQRHHGALAADKLSPGLGQQVVVENRGGASGTVATRAVAKGPADGYTLLLGYTSTLATAQASIPNVGYDPRKDFAPIGLIGAARGVLLVHLSVPCARRQRADRLRQGQSEAVPCHARGGHGNHSRLCCFRPGRRRHEAHPYKGSPGADTTSSAATSRCTSARSRLALVQGRQDPRARGHRPETLEHVPGPAHGRRVRPARLRRRADLRPDRARRHADARSSSRLNKELRAALAYRRGESGGSARKAPSRCRRRPRSMPP